MNDSTPGTRIRSARQLKRGLTQKELAARSGVSVSLLSKYEQGTAAPTAETLHKLAKGLRLNTSVLLGDPVADLADEPDVTAWEPVRQAIAGCHDAIPDREPTTGGLTGVIGGMVPLVLASEHDQLRLLLPGVLRDADLLVAAAGGSDEQAARALRSRARQLAGYLLCMTWQLDAAGDVLDLALDDAAGDRHLEMAAAHWRCWALMRSGDLDGCGSLASRWADATEPRLSRATPDELALWGRFQILVATAAARDNRPGEAGQALRIATAAAAALDGREVVPAANPWDVFGVRTVAMVRGEIAVVQDRMDTALRIGEKIRGDGFPVPRNWLRHRLDVATAHAASPAGRMDAAAVLQDIGAVAPQWLAQQRKARDVLAIVLKAPKRVPPPELRRLAELVRLPMS